MLEDSGSDGQITLGREPICDVANMRIDTENLLDDDDPRPAEGLRDQRAKLESALPLPASVQSTRPSISSRSSGN
jgi:hypothetical protein